MDIIKLIITNAVFISLFTLLIRHFFNKGLQKQKGEFESDLERLKTELQLEFSNKQELLNLKRNVYINLIDTMSIFLKDRVPVQDLDTYQKSFLKAYDTSWLWASDEVLINFSKFMQFKLDNSNENMSTYTQEQRVQTQVVEKKLFSECILAIRKDIGFPNTIITNDHYRFIYF